MIISYFYRVDELSKILRNLENRFEEKKASIKVGKSSISGSVISNLELKINNLHASALEIKLR